MRRKLRFLVSLGFALYAAVLLALPLLWWQFGERHWLLILLCYAPPIFYLVPVFPLAGAAALLRIKQLLVPTLLLVLVIGLGPMDFQFPSRGAPSGQARFSVLSYNVRAGLGGDGRGARESVADFLKGSQADLIGLQESRQPMDTRFEDPTPIIKETLSGYQSARGGHRGELLSLSRFPIISSQEHDLDGYSPCLEIIVDANGRQLRFLNVHVLTGDPKGVLKGKPKQRTNFLSVSAKSRRDQTAALRQVLAQSQLPTILVGDFNSPPGSALHQSLASVMQDSWAQKGLGFGLTYRSDRPLWRIDYLWASPNLGVENCYVLKTQLSDHKPLAGSFRW